MNTNLKVRITVTIPYHGSKYDTPECFETYKERIEETIAHGMDELVAMKGSVVTMYKEVVACDSD
jgi:hypothetical protein